MRNAFELLAAGAKGSSKGSSKTPASTNKGTYTTCPLCQRTVPLSFADAHVSVCLAAPAPSRPPASQQRGSGALRSPANGVLTPTSAQLTQHQSLTPTPQAVPAPSLHIQHPQVVDQQQPPPQPTDYAKEIGAPTVGVVTGAVEQPEEETRRQPQPPKPHEAGRKQQVPTPPVPPTQQQHEQRSCHTASEAPATQQVTQPRSSLDAGPRCSQGGGISAFDVMRQGQLRAASRCHTFFLERTAGGDWLGHCWAKGCATPAQQRLVASSCWSVTLTVATTGGAGKETVVMMTNVPPRDGGVVGWSTAGLPSNDLPPEGRWRGGPSVLKSALQKAVRLGRGGCAVRCALHLFKEDGGAAALLRRLSVVCVEDAILHPGLPLVVWLMGAQAKGFVLGVTHVEALLQLVYQLAVVAVRDGLPEAPWDGDVTAADAGGAASQGPASLQQVDELALPSAEGCLLKCLLFRASYGGMGGDVRMMRAFAAYWAARFKGAAAAPPPPPTSSSDEAAYKAQPMANAGLVGRAPNPPAPALAQPHAACPSRDGRGGQSCGASQEMSQPWPLDAQQPGLHAPLPGTRVGVAAAATRGTEASHVGPGDLRERAHPLLAPGGGGYAAEVGSGNAGLRFDASVPAGMTALLAADQLEHGLGPAATCGVGISGDDVATAVTGEGYGTAAAGHDSGIAGLTAIGAARAAVICDRGDAQASDEPSALRAQPASRRVAAETAASVPLGDSGSGGDCGGSQAWRCGGDGSQLTARDVRFSDAYFASRLQAEDAPPSCSAFMPASQLLAEALSEQRSLHRVAGAGVLAVSPHRDTQQTQPQSYPWHGSSGAVTEVAAGPTQPHSTQKEQLHRLGGQDLLRPRWHSGGGGEAAAGLVEGGRAGGAGPADGGRARVDSGGGRTSPWLSYLCSLYEQVPVPAALARTSCVGPMRRSDVPLSAVDFHVSDVVTRLLERPGVVALAPGPAAAGASPPATAAAVPEDVEAALKSAMWLFRSSKNPKVWVHRLSPCCGGCRAEAAGGGSRRAGGGCAEHRGLEAQLASEETSRRRLAAMWTVAAPWADRFSVGYIARRFGPP